MAAHEEPLPDVATFGRAVPEPLRTEVQNRLLEIMQAPGRRFPGSQPVSFESIHFGLVKSQPYLVCEKTDGSRYLLIVHEGRAYMIDRKFQVTEVPLVFPALQEARPDMRAPQMQSGTILDGELVMDILPGGVRRLTFLIFDTVAISGVSAARDHVLYPRFKFAHRVQEPCAVLLKQMYQVSALPDLFTTIMPALPHGNDGLIFTPVLSPYAVGTDNKLLKWKPLSLNSVDLKALVHTKCAPPPLTRVQLLVSKQGPLVPFSWLSFAEGGPPAGGLLKLNNKIVECRFDPEGKTWVPDLSAPTWHGGAGQWVPGKWTFMRVRTDKHTANDVSTVERVMQSQADNVTQDELIRELLGAEAAAATAAKQAAGLADVGAHAAWAPTPAGPPAAAHDSPSAATGPTKRLREEGVGGGTLSTTDQRLEPSDADEHIASRRRVGVDRPSETPAGASETWGGGAAPAEGY